MRMSAPKENSICPSAYRVGENRSYELLICTPHANATVKSAVREAVAVKYALYDLWPKRKSMVAIARRMSDVHLRSELSKKSDIWFRLN